MAKKAPNKITRIRNFVEKNPEATWKDAEPYLKKYGIRGNYFSLQKGRIKASQSNSAATPSKPRSGRQTTAGTSEGLARAAKFARSVGGIDQAQKLLAELADFQV